MLNRSKAKFGTSLIVLISIFSLSSIMLPATHAVEKAGAKCTTFGKTVVKGKTKLTCVKVTEYKWVVAPIKPAVGTIYNPVLPGKSF